jgi:hypothetical protein
MMFHKVITYQGLSHTQIPDPTVQTPFNEQPRSEVHGGGGVGGGVGGEGVGGVGGGVGGVAGGMLLFEYKVQPSSL